MKILYFTLIITIVNSCTPRTPSSGNTRGTTLYPLERATTISDMTPYIDSLQIVPLETTPLSFITYIKKILITRDKRLIILNSTGILAFNQTGKFLFKTGNFGRAPEEYIAPRDICLSIDNKYLMVLDCSNQVIKYNIQNGEFMERVIPETEKPGKSHPDFGEICPSVNDGFFLFCYNPSDITDFSEDFHCLIEFDKNGTYMNKYLPRKDFVFPHYIISQSYNNDYNIRPQEGDNVCYKIANGKLDSTITLDFKKEYIPARHIHPMPGRGFPIQEYMHSKYYKLPIYIHDTPGHFYFSCCAPKAKDTYFLFSLKNHKGIRWENDPIEEDLFRFAASDSSYFYGIYNDYKEYSVSERQNMKNPLKKYILNKTNISLASKQLNPFIIKIKFKL